MNQKNHLENMNTSEKISQKIKILTTGSKYGLTPEGMDHEEVVNSIKLNKKIYKVFLPLTILTAAISLTILFSNIFEIAPLNYEAAPLLILLTISLIVQTMRLKAYLQKLASVLFLFEIKESLNKEDSLIA